ncbi:MAG: hypothetical protein IAI50_19170 [Candidatus Eremiobacteraeota bacterium]|nr:hypothetical protein [Candidatus Eremiobacteraeota bacterium]
MAPPGTALLEGSRGSDRHQPIDPGLLYFFGSLVEKYGMDSIAVAPLDVSIEVGSSGVFLLTVRPDALSEAASFSAELSVFVEEEFSKRYSVIVIVENEEDISTTDD